ncbi:MAG: GAF domain-containing protein, partial [Acidimicrobiia bacterium]|nr:GAF domain-containing protein [Acidimicrobiia bacterium]
MNQPQPRVRDPGRLMALASLELVPGDPQRLLDQIAGVATALLSATLGASVITWNPQTEEYVTAASTVPGQERRAVATSVRRTGGMTRAIIDSRRPMIVTDTTTSEGNNGRLIDEYGIRAFVGVPIMSEEGVLGVLYVLDSEPREYDAGELAFMETLASRAASAMGTAAYIQELESTSTEHRDTVFRARDDRKRADAVARVANALMTVHEPEEDLRVVADGIGQALRADRVILVTVDMIQRKVLHQVVGGREAHQIGPLSYEQLMDGLTGWAIGNRVGVTSNEPDTRESEATRQTRVDEGSGPMVIVPMFFTDRLAGTLTVIRGVGKPPFSQPESATIEVMASQAKLALERHRLMAITRQSLEETESLLETAVNLMTITDPAVMLKSIVEATTAALPADMAEAHLVDTATQSVHHSAVAGYTDSLSDPWDGLLGAALRGSEGVLSSSPDDPGESDPSRAARVERGIGPMAVMPIRARGQVLGVLLAGNRGGEAPFDDHDLDLMAALVSMASAAITNVRLLAENQRL